jgi:hypothetical protein
MCLCTYCTARHRRALLKIEFAAACTEAWYIQGFVGNNKNVAHAKTSLRISFIEPSRTSPLHGEDQGFDFLRAHNSFSNRGRKIKRKLSNMGAKSCTTLNKLCNTEEVNKELLTKVMTDRYIDEDGNPRIDMLWEELIPEEMDDINWDDPNDPYQIEAEAKLREALKRKHEEEAEEQAKAGQAKRNLSFTREELDYMSQFGCRGFPRNRLIGSTVLQRYYGVALTERYRIKH